MKKFVLGIIFVFVMLVVLIWVGQIAPPAAASPLLGFTPTFTPPPTNTPTVTPTSTATPPPEPTSPPAATPVPGDNTPTPAAPTDTPTALPLLPQTGGSTTIPPQVWLAVALLGGGLLFHLLPARRRNQ
ncbi:MAG: hypothetical protein JW934_23295 [Anaerolineae bacterium]|nr:hypothetical protein [Anaerolineae bacterium]